MQTNATNPTYTGNADFAVRVTYSGTIKDTIKAWRGLLMIKYATTGGDTSFKIQNANSTDFWSGSGADGAPSGTITNMFSAGETGDYTFAIVYDDSEGTLESFFLKDGAATSIFKTDSVDIGDWITIAAGEDGRALTGDGAIFNDSTSYKVEYTSNISALPEPTALALLALGVAGLALKRKVK